MTGCFQVQSLAFQGQPDLQCLAATLLPSFSNLSAHMKDLEDNPYPGSNAGPAEIVALADEYHLAAKFLMKTGRPRKPLSRAPARLCAIHAIELYLNAFLMHRGAPREKVRGHFHNLAERAKLAIADGLVFRQPCFLPLQKALQLVRRAGLPRCKSLQRLEGPWCCDGTRTCAR